MTRGVLQTLLHHLLLQHHDAVHECFRPRRTSRDVHVDGNDRIDPLHHGVVVKHAARGRTGPHRNHPLRLWHLLIDPSNDGRKFQRHTSGTEEHIGLARGVAESLHPKSCKVEATGGGRHEFDGAAGRTEGHRPQRTCTGPVHEEVEAGGDPAILRASIDLKQAALRGRVQSHVNAPFFQT